LRLTITREKLIDIEFVRDQLRPIIINQKEIQSLDVRRHCNNHALLEPPWIAAPDNRLLLMPPASDTLASEHGGVADTGSGKFLHHSAHCASQPWANHRVRHS
jgi:hypothetical protein